MSRTSKSDKKPIEQYDHKGKERSKAGWSEMISELATTGSPARMWKPYPVYKYSSVEWLGEDNT